MQKCYAIITNNGNDQSGFLECVIRTQLITPFICCREMGGWKGLKAVVFWFFVDVCVSAYGKYTVYAQKEGSLEDFCILQISPSCFNYVRQICVPFGLDSQIF